MNEKTSKNKLVDKIRSVNNFLLTVSRDPSVDELSAALGLSLALNKLGKRSVAVFSGQVPPAINFLHPEKTFENNADSLRDFIISLDKDKADRLRCKADGDFVKVYITPYKTKITTDDLKFEEGDFNIELIIAIGVTSRDELDAAIASHGKIFHDAIVATINLSQVHDVLGSISWQEQGAGCLCEMCADLTDALSDNSNTLMDESIATAFLTGVVAATNQFRNKVTTPAIMTLAANLMARGANQQLISSELSAANTLEVANASTTEEALPTPAKMSPDKDEGTSLGDLSIGHLEQRQEDTMMPSPVPDELNMDSVKRENDRLAEQRSDDALALAKSQLTEAELTDDQPLADAVHEAGRTAQTAQPAQATQSVEPTPSMLESASAPPAIEPSLSQPLPPVDLPPVSFAGQSAQASVTQPNNTIQPLHPISVQSDNINTAPTESHSSQPKTVVPAYAVANQISPIQPMTNDMSQYDQVVPPSMPLQQGEAMSNEMQMPPNIASNQLPQIRPDMSVPLPPPPPIPAYNNNSISGGVGSLDSNNNMSSLIASAYDAATPANQSSMHVTDNSASVTPATASSLVQSAPQPSFEPISSASIPSMQMPPQPQPVQPAVTDPSQFVIPS